jgi:hypothetical protein
VNFDKIINKYRNEATSESHKESHKGSSFEKLRETHGQFPEDLPGL